MSLTIALYLVVLAGYIPAAYLAWSLNRAADALEEHTKAHEPQPPAGWVPAHAAATLRQPTRELIGLAAR